MLFQHACLHSDMNNIGDNRVKSYRDSEKDECKSMNRIARVIGITYERSKVFEEDCFGRRCNVSNTVPQSRGSLVQPRRRRRRRFLRLIIAWKPSIRWNESQDLLTQIDRLSRTASVRALSTYRECGAGELWPILPVRVLGGCQVFDAWHVVTSCHPMYDMHAYIHTYVRVIGRIRGIRRILSHWISFEIPKERQTGRGIRAGWTRLLEDKRDKEKRTNLAFPFESF